MRMLTSLLLIIGRLYTGVKVLHWLILKSIDSAPHPISEIEVILVWIIFDTWVSISQSGIDIKISKKEDS